MGLERWAERMFGLFLGWGKNVKGPGHRNKCKMLMDNEIKFYKKSDFLS
jgi:hypothetical protein